MKKTLFTALAWVLLAGVAIVLPFTSAHAVETFKAETETRIYDPAKSYGGYFLPSQLTSGNTTYLMDMQGNVVHKWDDVGGVPRLLPNGNLSSHGKWQGVGAATQPYGTVASNAQLRDWDNNILFAYNPKTDSNRDYYMNHEGRWIWNKKLKAYTILLMCDRTATKAEIIAAGGDPNWDYSMTNTAGGPRGRGTNINSFIEVDMNKNIVWEWQFIDHTCQSKNPSWPNYVSDVKLAPGKVDAHWMTDDESPEGCAGICNDWMHSNSIDYNEDLDLIAINAKHWSTFVVIDHAKTFVSTTDWAANRAAAKSPDGDIIYRFGNPSNYNQGIKPSFQYEGHSQMYGAHDIQWIRPYHWERPHPEAGDKWLDPAALYGTKSVALPGAGNFLIFDNGCYNPTGYRSRILEINPYLNAQGVNTGWFVNPPDAGYTKTVQPDGAVGRGVSNRSKQIVGLFQSTQPNSFYSSYISGMQRLPNGNTSINAGADGHMFEVTPTGEVVWEYLWPGVVGSSKTVTVDATAGLMYRHYRYGANYPGLAGKDLTPQGTITGRLPRLVGSTDTYPAPVTYTGFGYAPGGTTAGGGGAAGGASGGSGGGGY